MKTFLKHLRIKAFFFLLLAVCTGNLWGQCNITATPLATSCTTGCNGSAIAYASGNAPFHFVWSNGDSANKVNNLCPGNYTVTVTDSKSCQKTASVSVDSVSCGSKLGIFHFSFLQNPTTISTDDSLSFFISNYGSADFIGKIYLYYQNLSDSLASSLSVFDSTVSVATIPKGDSLSGATLGFTRGKINISLSRFRNNFTNIIVIWPYAQSGDFGTSVTSNLIVGNVESAPLLSKPVNGYSLYPNPSNSLIFIRSFDSKYDFENVRIYNNLGALVQVCKGPVRELNITELPNGLYTLQIESGLRLISNLRFIKQ